MTEAENRIFNLVLEKEYLNGVAKSLKKSPIDQMVIFLIVLIMIMGKLNLVCKINFKNHLCIPPI